MNDTETIRQADTRRGKEQEWLEHKDELMSKASTHVGGAVCQSRFSSSKTAIPMFREEARSTSSAADERGGATTATTTARLTPGQGQRCKEAGQEGTWRYCFEEMKWLLDSNVANTRDGGDGGNGGNGGNGGREAQAREDKERLERRVQQLENILHSHGITVPPSPK